MLHLVCYIFFIYFILFRQTKNGSMSCHSLASCRSYNHPTLPSNLDTVARIIPIIIERINSFTM